jgi:hypothetical protein
MKRLFIIIALMLVVVSVQAQIQTELKGYGFTGVRYTHAVTGKSSALGSIGFLTKVAGPLYNAEYIDVGSYGKINSDWIILTPVQPGSPLYVGFLAGPSADFKPVGEKGEIISYLAGAGGLMQAFQFRGEFLGFKNPGVWAIQKYNFSFDNATTYVNGWTIGAGIYLPF